ncbi:hypothetical protein [Kamptonema formosum]|uniref:hypothetical protein n=1 Tax=Kamptonema formosum TaxID=331992 RepID=UPI0003472D67|nr:hypothetical protein [Oscillatoria sp. PCC 10802]
MSFAGPWAPGTGTGASVRNRSPARCTQSVSALACFCQHSASYQALPARASRYLLHSIHREVLSIS